MRLLDVGLVIDPRNDVMLTLLSLLLRLSDRRFPGSTLESSVVFIVLAIVVACADAGAENAEELMFVDAVAGSQREMVRWVENAINRKRALVRVVCVRVHCILNMHHKHKINAEVLGRGGGVNRKHKLRKCIIFGYFQKKKKKKKAQPTLI